MSETEQPREVIEAGVLQEITALEKKDPKAFHRKLNNFWMRLIPYSASEDEGTPRSAALASGKMDRKLKDYVKPMDVAACSPKRLEQTSREFFDTIDSTLEELDTDHTIRSEAASIKDLRGLENLPQREEALHNLNSKIIPVYARLRSLGYNDGDLT